ncbi:uncharacterized protein [Venturia canescens]|uniref:uncharacterized protein n=1 Tax=Venturia canescens TaxID=32260 RepID=UPI001C9BECE9|nr:uncharacterized protein LOC122411332 [Venturia canescens]
MFSLVFWTDNKSVSVEPTERVINSSGFKARVKWGKKKYDAVILAQSDDETWIKNLSVNRQGIITGYIGEGVPANLSTEPTDEVNHDETDQEEQDTEVQDHEVHDIGVRDTEVQGNEVRDTEQENLATTELVPNSGVLIAPNILRGITQKHRKDARKMAGALIKALIVRDDLKRMCAMGSKEYLPIPPEIRKAVEKYVYQTVESENQLTHEEFKRCLTRLCSNLRTRK